VKGGRKKPFWVLMSPCTLLEGGREAIKRRNFGSREEGQENGRGEVRGKGKKYSFINVMVHTLELASLSVSAPRAVGTVGGEKGSTVH